MSSIIESYRVVRTKEDVRDTFPRPPSQLPEDDEFNPSNSVINRAEDSPESKAWGELVDSLGDRVKQDTEGILTNKDTGEVTIYTGGASAIKVKVIGYADPDAVNAARAQEDAVVETLPPVETPRTTAPDEVTDQVDAIRKYNTEQYMKHSRLNPKKFG